MIAFNEDTRVKFPATVQFLHIGHGYQPFTKEVDTGVTRS